MASHPPDFSSDQFMWDTAAGGSRARLGTIDEYLTRWDEMNGKPATTKRPVLFGLVAACVDWIDGYDKGRAHYRLGHYPAVRNLRDMAFERLQYNTHEGVKSSRGRIARWKARRKLKSLAGAYAKEAQVLDKANYHGQHMGSNALDLIYRGFSEAGQLDNEKKELLDRFKKENNFPERDRKDAHEVLSTQQWRAFSDFANAHNIDQGWRQEYFSKDKRMGDMLLPMEGVWYQRAGQPFDTGGTTWAYAVDEYGCWYAREGRAGVINHSSLCRGKPVMCAGMLIVNKGSLVYLSNESGHYQPSRKHLQRAFKTLEGVFSFNLGESVCVEVVGGPDNARVVYGRKPGFEPAMPMASATAFLHSANAPGNGGKDYKDWG